MGYDGKRRLDGINGEGDAGKAKWHRETEMDRDTERRPCGHGDRG